MKLLKEKYKTWEGANKRVRFENSLAKSEYERGCKAKMYRYTLVQEGDFWRVARLVSVWGFTDSQAEKKYGLG